jgi:hypothetical protein
MEGKKDDTDLESDADMIVDGIQHSQDARTLAREKARIRKEKRANDPHYQALKASWQKSRKEAYQKQKEKAKALRQEKKKSEREAKIEARRKKDSELLNCLKPGIQIPETAPQPPKTKLKLVYNSADEV